MEAAAGTVTTALEGQDGAGNGGGMDSAAGKEPFWAGGWSSGEGPRGERRGRKTQSPEGQGRAPSGGGVGVPFTHLQAWSGGAAAAGAQG